MTSWHDNISNRIIREPMGDEDTKKTIRRRRLKWIGHVIHVDKDRRANQVMIWLPEGKIR